MAEVAAAPMPRPRLEGGGGFKAPEAPKGLGSAMGERGSSLPRNMGSALEASRATLPAVDVTHHLADVKVDITAPVGPEALSSAPDRMSMGTLTEKPLEGLPKDLSAGLATGSGEGEKPPGSDDAATAVSRSGEGGGDSPTAGTATSAEGGGPAKPVETATDTGEAVVPAEAPVETPEDPSSKVSVLSDEDRKTYDGLKQRQDAGDKLSLTDQDKLNSLEGKASADPKDEFARLEQKVANKEPLTPEEKAFAERYDAAVNPGEAAEATEAKSEHDLHVEKMDELADKIANGPEDEVADRLAEMLEERDKFQGKPVEPDARKTTAQTIRETLTEKNAGRPKERPIEKEVQEQTAELMQALAEVVNAPKTIELLKERKNKAEGDAKAADKKMAQAKNPNEKYQAGAQMSIALQEGAFFQARMDEAKGASKVAIAKYKRITNHLMYKLGMKGALSAVVGWADAKVAEVGTDAYISAMS